MEQSFIEIIYNVFYTRASIHYSISKVTGNRYFNGFKGIIERMEKLKNFISMKGDQ